MARVSEICWDMVIVSLPNQSKDTIRADAVKIPVRRRVKNLDGAPADNYYQCECICGKSSDICNGASVTS